MFVGYARTSTVDQIASFEGQTAALDQAGCEKVFSEQVSAVARHRPELEATLDFVREGDTLVVVKLDRLARSVAHLVEITGKLEAKGAHLRILDQNMDTGTPSGRLMLHVFRAVAEFERSLLLERQRVGIAKAKAEGKYRGRAPTARAKSQEVLAMKAERHRPTDIARALNISRASVYRIIGDAPVES